MDTLTVRPSVIEFEQIPLHGVVAIDINGHAITDRAAPFTAAARSVYSHVCEECFAASNGRVPSCSPPDIEVRRHGDAIYWFLADCELNPANVPLHQVWSFARQDYEQQCEGVTSSLPGFDSAEIESLLKRVKIFPPQLGLYTIPDLPDDPQGRDFLAAVERIIDAGQFEVTTAPEQYRSIRVGIETAGVPECSVGIGLSADRCVVRFAENPGFPLWVTSPEIESRFRHLADLPGPP